MLSIIVNKYSVKYSLRDPHGAHTVTFTHVGQGVSGDHISKIHFTSIMTSRLQASSYESQSCKAAHEIIVLKYIGREINHIATGTALSLDGEAFRGHFPVPAACRNRDSCPPDLGFVMAAALEGFSYRGFFVSKF